MGSMYTVYIYLGRQQLGSKMINAVNDMKIGFVSSFCMYAEGTTDISELQPDMSDNHRSVLYMAQ